MSYINIYCENHAAERDPHPLQQQQQSGHPPWGGCGWLGPADATAADSAWYSRVELSLVT